MMSRNSFEFDNREMATAGNELRREVEMDARPPLHEDLGFGAGGGARPGGAGLEARGAAGGPAAEVDFVRRGALKSGVGPVAVVPEKEQLQLALKGAAQQGNNGEHTGAAVFQGSDEGLDDGMLPVRPTRRSGGDAMPKAPRLEAAAGELRPAVGDEVLRRGADAGNDTAEKLAHRLRCRLAFENGAAQSAAGIMIDHDREPPAKRPTLRQREGQPRGPETGRGRHDGWENPSALLWHVVLWKLELRDVSNQPAGQHTGRTRHVTGRFQLVPKTMHSPSLDVAKSKEELSNKKRAKLQFAGWLFRAPWFDRWLRGARVPIRRVSLDSRLAGSSNHGKHAESTMLIKDNHPKVRHEKNKEAGQSAVANEQIVAPFKPHGSQH